MRIVLLLVLGAAAVSVAGCGDDDYGGDSGVSRDLSAAVDLEPDLTSDDLSSDDLSQITDGGTD